MKKVVEPGSFTISSGPNSVDLKSAKLVVTGPPLLLATTARPSSGE
jgi:hypothetical protein